MLIAIKDEMSMRFAWEDWDKKYSRSRRTTSGILRDPNDSTSRTRRLSSTAPKVTLLTPQVTPAGQRSLGRENRGKSTGHRGRSVQLRASTPMPKISTGARRPAAKSVRSRGTQLDSTPIPIAAGVSSPRALLTPNVNNMSPILRRLEQTPLESTSLAAWNHFRSPSVVGQTPNPRRPETSTAEASGSGIESLLISEVLSKKVAHTRLSSVGFRS